MAVSEAKKKANAKYDNKAYVKTLVRLKPEDNEIMELHLKKYNYTKNGFINEAIKEKIKNDEEKTPPN